MALISVFLLFVFLLFLLSSLLTFCLFLVVCFFLFSFSFVFFLGGGCCSHPCCPLLMHSLFVFVSIVPTFPCSVSYFSYFFFFFFFLFFLSLFLPFSPLSMYCPAWHPPKNRKTWFCFYWQNRAGLSEFQNNDILWENIALCCRVQTKFGVIRFFKFPET